MSSILKLVLVLKCFRKQVTNCSYYLIFLSKILLYITYNKVRHTWSLPVVLPYNSLLSFLSFGFFNYIMCIERLCENHMRCLIREWKDSFFYIFIHKSFFNHNQRKKKIKFCFPTWEKLSGDSYNINSRERNLKSTKHNKNIHNMMISSLMCGLSHHFNLLFAKYSWQFTEWLVFLKPIFVILKWKLIREGISFLVNIVYYNVHDNYFYPFKQCF